MIDGPSRLRRVMRARGLTQVDIERALGLSDGAVCRYLSGQRTPDLKPALLLERALGIPARSWVDLPPTASIPAA